MMQKYKITCYGQHFLKKMFVIDNIINIQLK